jgi:hypothetical protein
MDYSAVKKDILAALTYFNLFNYPLKKGEIFIFLGQCDDMDVFEEALDSLIRECVIFRIGHFYSTGDNHALANRRILGNERAVHLLKKAERAALIISYFPFVKGVAVSGSLSKNFADEHADVDFFIITDANRLWIARTCLHMMKKLAFLVRKQDLFCMNYFVDECDMVIQEKNIYTAVEVSTVLPLQGSAVFEQFFRENNWIRKYFPNKYLNFSRVNEMKGSRIKKFIQWIFRGHSGDVVDNFLMNLTAKRWGTKTAEGKRNSKGMILSMGIGKHYSKPNPENFQKRVLQRYEKSLAENYTRFELSRYF